jgi:hypothetical protein
MSNLGSSQRNAVTADRRGVASAAIIERGVELDGRAARPEHGSCRTRAPRHLVRPMRRSGAGTLSPPIRCRRQPAGCQPAPTPDRLQQHLVTVRPPLGCSKGVAFARAPPSAPRSLLPLAMPIAQPVEPTPEAQRQRLAPRVKQRARGAVTDWRHSAGGRTRLYLHYACQVAPPLTACRASRPCQRRSPVLTDTCVGQGWGARTGRAHA